MRNDYPKIIGSFVHGKIDRPIGSHHPKYPDMTYPLNYGYVDDILAEDGEQQDIYLLGSDKPLTEFGGYVIAVYRRDNDNEDKWIISLDNKNYSNQEILKQIAFQEKFFTGKLLRWILFLN